MKSTNLLLSVHIVHTSSCSSSRLNPVPSPPQANHFFCSLQTSSGTLGAHFLLRQRSQTRACDSVALTLLFRLGPCEHLQLGVSIEDNIVRVCGDSYLFVGKASGVVVRVWWAYEEIESALRIII